MGKTDADWSSGINPVAYITVGKSSLLIAEALVGIRFIVYFFIPFFVIPDERLGRLDLGLAWGNAVL